MMYRPYKDRGWTDTLISKHLGKADRWATVDHFRNFEEKHTYFLACVEQAEDEFNKSISRRGIKKSNTKEFLNNRDDIRTMQILEKVTETF